jgi:hypothetical protein
MEDGSILPVLVENRTGYKNLCELLTQAHLRSEKGKCAVRWDELPEFAQGLIAFLGSARLQRAGFGILPKQSLKSSRMQNAFASMLQACAPRNCHQTFSKFWQLIPAHGAFAFFAAQVGLGQQFAQVFVAGAIFHQHRQNAAVFHGQFGANDWPDAVLARSDGKSLRTVNAIAIEQRDGRHFQICRDLR